jgi:hypothetical protein
MISAAQHATKWQHHPAVYLAACQACPQANTAYQYNPLQLGNGLLADML